MKHLKLFEDFNIDIYEHGRCELFALALHEELGYEMYLFLDEEAEFDNYYGEALIHAYTKSPNDDLFDASGKVTLEDIENHGDWNVDWHRHININIFQEYVNSGFFTPYTKSEIYDCRKYISNNIEKYT